MPKLLHQQLAILVVDLDQRDLEMITTVSGRCRLGLRLRLRLRLGSGGRCALVDRHTHLFESHLLKGLADSRVGLGVGLLAVAVGIELVVQHILGFQKGVDDVAAQRQLATTCVIEDVLEQVGGVLQHIEAEGAGTALDRVGGTENGVELLGVGIIEIQLQQVPLHIAEKLFGLFEKCVVKVGDIHAHSLND